jgi:hypothetical protein
MTAQVLTPPAAGPTRPGAATHVVRALAAAELRRTVRNPALYVGIGLSLWLLREIDPRTETWSGESYQSMATAAVGLLWGISVVTAFSFHRERTSVAPGAPVPDHRRVLGRLAAAAPLVALTGAFAGLLAWRQRDLGGLTLGIEPGRTTEALFSVPELLQAVALGVLAVAVGAALGRRMPHPATAVPLLFVFWFAVGAVYWLFGHRDVTPFSVVQVQPITVPVGPANANPLDFPSFWLLSGPGDYQASWSRELVSEGLAWWHDGWLLGLSLLLVATVVPHRRARRLLLVVGAVVAAVSVLAQYRVIP